MVVELLAGQELLKVIIFKKYSTDPIYSSFKFLQFPLKLVLIRLNDTYGLSYYIEHFNIVGAD